MEFRVRDKVRIKKGETAGHYGTVTRVETGMFNTFYTVRLDYPRITHPEGKLKEIWDVRCKASALELIREVN